MKNFKNAIIATSAALLLSGCATNDLNKPEDPQFGQALQAAYDAQIISKTPAIGAPKGDPQVQAGALERYKTGNVIKPSTAK